MRIVSRTSATAVTLSSSATYASIVPGTAVARRRRASDPSAPAGVVTARTRMPAACSGCSAAETSADDASVTTTG